jgi:hypothetical protein
MKLLRGLFVFSAAVLSLLAACGFNSNPYVTTIGTDNTVADVAESQLANAGTYSTKSAGWGASYVNAYDAKIATKATAGTAESWLEFNLPGGYTLTRARILEDNAGNSELGQWKVQYYTGTQWLDCFAYANSNSAAWQEKNFPDVYGATKVRLYCKPPAGKTIEIQEFEIYGGLCGSTAPDFIVGTPLCEPNTSANLQVMGGSLGLGATWKWYNEPSCTSPAIATGPSIYLTPAITSTFYVRAEGACNITAPKSFTVTVNARPVIVNSSAVGPYYWGSRGTLTSGNLLVTDAETTDPSQIIYTITELPVGVQIGWLTGYYGGPLSVGSTFTQAEINCGSIGTSCGRNITWNANNPSGANQLLKFKVSDGTWYNDIYSINPAVTGSLMFMMH